MENREVVGIRLREERIRLRESQESLAARAGVGKNAQIKYEKGERSPDADYLVNAAAAGVDVLFVLTGLRRPETASTAAELRLLASAVNKVHAGDADDLDMPQIEQAYKAQYNRAVAAGKAPAITLTERHIKLLGAFDQCTEAGRKSIERIASLEAARKPVGKRASITKVDAQAVDIRGDGNVVGAHNHVSTNLAPKR